MELSGFVIIHYHGAKAIVKVYLMTYSEIWDKTRETANVMFVHALGLMTMTMVTSAYQFTYNSQISWIVCMLNGLHSIQ